VARLVAEIADGVNRMTATSSPVASTPEWRILVRRPEGTPHPQRESALASWALRGRDLLAARGPDAARGSVTLEVLLVLVGQQLGDVGAGVHRCLAFTSVFASDCPARR
jgi:hypothetical protein